MLQQASARWARRSAVPHIGSKRNSLLVEDSREGNVVSCSEQNLEAVLSLLIAAWGFNSFWLTGGRAVRCLKQKSTEPKHLDVWVPEMPSQNPISSFWERYKHVEHQM